MNETDVFVPNDLHLVDEPEPAKVVPQHFLCHALIQSSDVNVPACTILLNRSGNSTRNGTRLAPPNLELLSVKTKLFEARVGVESSGCRSVQEAEENAGLFGKDANRL